MKSNPLPLLLALLALPVVSASAQLVGYTDGSQVNLLNAYNSALGLSGTNSGSSLTADQARFFYDNGAPSQVERFASSGPVATLDFGAVRTVATISTVSNFSGYGFSAATVRTSNDGTTWTTYSGGMTVASSTANAGNNTLTFSSPVSARYVEVTPTTFENGSGGRWYFNTMRAFGNTGTLAGDTNLTILANGGFSVAQNLSAIGSISQINSAELIDPATSPHATRTLLYNIGNGEGFQLDLGQTFTVDRATIELDHQSTAPLTLTLSGSTDGTNFSTLYTTTWTPSLGLDSLKFSFTAGDARWLNATFASTDTDIRVSDFAFFQNPVPEPSTYALAALGVSAVLFRLRRKVRME